MASIDTLLPPMQPILKALRTKADIIDLTVAYTHEGELVSDVSFVHASNGSRGRLSKVQTRRVLEFVDAHGLRPLVQELSKTGVAVRY